MIDFIKTNKIPALMAALFITVAMGMFMIQGCSLGDIIKHSVPKAIQPVNDGEAKVSLRESPRVRQAYVDKVTRDLASYDESAENAAFVFGLVSSAINLGLDSIDESALPGGAIALGIIGSIGTFFLKRPGEEQRVAGEKQDSYNAGLKAGQALAAAVTERVV